MQPECRETTNLIKVTIAEVGHSNNQIPAGIGIATECLKKSASLQGLPREERLLALLGNACASVVFNASSAGAGWPAYFDPAQAGEDGRGESVLNKGVPLERLSLIDIDREALEGELVRTVSDWSSILS